MIRFYDDDGEETSEWGGTDLTGAAMGGSILGPEFPLRKGMSMGIGGSSRFSAGPRSQVNFPVYSKFVLSCVVQTGISRGKMGLGDGGGGVVSLLGAPLTSEHRGTIYSTRTVAWSR